jgi:Fur family peroxide stress response transcriptional regulator
LVRDDAIILALRNKGFRVTPQRLDISKIILRHKNHPSAEDIYDEVKRIHPALSLSTVYNTLNILDELDIIQELAFSDKPSRFDNNTEPHINMVCKNCGKIYDIRNKELKDIIQKLANRENFTLTGQRFDVFGICKSCNFSLGG